MNHDSTSKHDAVRHIVIFKYREGATEEQIQAVADGFRAMASKVGGVVAFENGINNSPEGLNRGLTHIYLLTFQNAAARDTYLPHPEHKKFGENVGRMEIIEEVFVIDYVLRD